MLGFMERYMKACALDRDLPKTGNINVQPFSRETMCEIDSFKNFVRKKFQKDTFDNMHFAKYMWHVVKVSASTFTSVKSKMDTRRSC